MNSHPLTCPCVECNEYYKNRRKDDLFGIGDTVEIVDYGDIDIIKRVHIICGSVYYELTNTDVWYLEDELEIVE